MGFLNSLYSVIDPVDVLFESRSQTHVDGKMGPIVYTRQLPAQTTGTLKGIYYVASSAKSYISEKFIAEVDAVLLIDYLDINVIIKDNARVKVNDRYFSIVTTDDIAMQNEVYIFLLKRFDTT